MKFTIYKTTNLKNGKFYIGKHQTENPEDDYLGSGKGILFAIKKHGKDCFKKEILFIFETEEEMNNKEREILTLEFVSSGNNYNEGVGGEGGPHFKGRKHSEETKEGIRRTNTGKKLTEEHKKKISIANTKRIVREETKRKISEKAKGRKHSEETKERIRRTNTGKKLTE